MTRGAKVYRLASMALCLVAIAFVDVGAEGAAIPWQLKCRFRSLTNISCPLCGMTTSARYLFLGRPGAAFRAHPLGPALVAIALAYSAVISLSLIWPSRIRITLGLEAAALKLLAIVLLVFWCFRSAWEGM